MVLHPAPGGTPKYIVCNGDEGEPGTIKDRYLMEGDPHKILEGMAIAGYAVGASRGFIYCRGEYFLSKCRLEKAIKQATARGFLGENLFDSDFSFNVEVRSGFGCYICGEETALIESIEGKRGYPRLKPPFPGVSGLWGRPTVVNNVETLASVPAIINRGGAWYKDLGTADTPGTKIYQVIGQVQTPQIVEAPAGITLRELIDTYGGGLRPGRSFKMCQTGGASAGLVTAEHLDVPMDFGALAAVGGALGRHHAGDGRIHLRGGFPAVRGGVFRARILRPVHPLPGRNAPPAADPDPHLPGQGRCGPGLPGTAGGHLDGCLFPPPGAIRRHPLDERPEKFPPGN